MLGDRSAQRHLLDLPARLRIGDHVLRCRIRNMSSGGVAIVGAPLQIGARAMLSLSAPYLKKFQAGCVVRWSSGDTTGLQFVGLNAVETSMLARYIHHATRPTEKLPAGALRPPATGS